MLQTVLTLENVRLTLERDRNFSRIPHILSESHQYPSNHKGFWNGEPMALGSCSHIPMDISWAVKNESVPVDPF